MTNVRPWGPTPALIVGNVVIPMLIASLVGAAALATFTGHPPGAFPAVSSVSSDGRASTNARAASSSSVLFPCLTSGLPVLFTDCPSTRVPQPHPAGSLAPAFQARWTEVHPPNSPPNRTQTAMGYDAADGYVVMFGGMFVNKTNIGGGVCLNDTWGFIGGVWTNLTAPGPTAGCAAAMTYDAADGYILLFGGFPDNHSRTSGETWKFSHGAWTRLNVPGPSARGGGHMAFDDAAGYVLLWGGIGGFNDTWAFSGGTWTSLGTGGPPTTTPDAGAMAYDPAAQAVILVAEWMSPGANQTWEFSQGAWTRLSVPQTPWLLYPALAYDPIDEVLVLIGGQTSNVDATNETYGFSAGSWTDLAIAGPPPRAATTMTFDPVDGTILMFGGEHCCQPVPLYGSGNLGDTWEFADAPVAVSLSIVVQPGAICSTKAPECPAGGVDAQVTIAAEVVLVPPGGGSTGAGVAVYGPFHWLDRMGVQFVPWRSISIDATRPVLTSCQGAGGSHACPPGSVGGSSTSGIGSIAWLWSQTPSTDVLRLGDQWSASFYVQVNAQPAAPVPVDACVTSECLAAGASMVSGMFTDLQFAPYGNQTVEPLSYPPALVSVDPVQGAESPPPSSAPPPPPGPGPALPVAPTPVPAPLPLPLPASVALSAGGTPVSLQAAAAGLLVAGLTRAALRSEARTVRMANPLRVGRRRATPRPRIRGDS
jgi:hypothetical protein